MRTIYTLLAILLLSLTSCSNDDDNIKVIKERGPIFNTVGPVTAGPPPNTYNERCGIVTSFEFIWTVRMNNVNHYYYKYLTIVSKTDGKTRAYGTSQDNVDLTIQLKVGDEICVPN